MAIKKKDFVEVEYTGSLKEDGFVFDTTDEKVAKEHNIYSPKTEYGPIIICVGEKHILEGVDDFIDGKELGEYTVDLDAEHAFGKKNPKLIQMIPTKEFTKHKIRPQVGLQLEIDGKIGTVKTVSGGRTLVDLNHPLSGKDVVYKVKINKVVDDKSEQIKAFMKVALGMKDPKMTLDGDKVKIELKQNLPEPVSKALGDRISELTGVKTVEFVSTGEQ